MTAPRLTIAEARVGMKVTALNDWDGVGKIVAGQSYTVSGFDHGVYEPVLLLLAEAGGRWVSDLFTIATPALPAMTPELLAALREMHDVYGGEPNKWLGGTMRKLLTAIEATPGILALVQPEPAGVTDVPATLPKEWWA